MKLSQEIIEITNKANMKGLYPKEVIATLFKYTNLGFFERKAGWDLGQLVYNVSVTVQDGKNYHLSVNYALVLYGTFIGNMLYYKLMSVAKLTVNGGSPIAGYFLDNAKNLKLTNLYLIDTNQPLNERFLSDFKIDMPKVLLEYSPEFYTSIFFFHLIHDKRSKFYIEEVNKVTVQKTIEKHFF